MMLFRNGSYIHKRLSSSLLKSKGTIAKNASFSSSIANNTIATTKTNATNNNESVVDKSNNHKNKTLLIPRSYLSTFAPSRICNERIKINVPTMGDSITEGTIVEWCVPIGGYANEGDVVALIETDKVTVDIKAEESGVVITHYGNVDDSVEVGSLLYQIDTEAQPTVTSDSDATDTNASAESSDGDVPLPSPTTIITTEEANIAETKEARTPSIKFLGKEGWMKRLQGITEDTEEEVPLITYIEHLPPMYGRPDITQDEMDALVLGGASLAPELIQKSSNPVFKEKRY